MSEIFNFLKQAESERREKSPEASAPAEFCHPEPSTDAASVPNDPAGVEPAPARDEPIAELVPDRIEIISPEKFDLSGADHQIKHVLDPLTLVGEQFRLLRSKLALMQKQRGVKTVLITSAVPQEGKTFTACGLAGVIAQEPGKRVILIDADMRKPKSGRPLGLNGSSPNQGLSQVLRGEASLGDTLLCSTGFEFYFLPAGPVPPNPSELLSSPGLEQMVRSAAESFDWVIVDSPPVLALSDATLIAPICDIVLLVVKANVTPSKLAHDAIQRIGKERICGVVMNRVKHIHSSRYYYHYYHKDSKRRQ